MNAFLKWTIFPQSGYTGFPQALEIMENSQYDQENHP